MLQKHNPKSSFAEPRCGWSRHAGHGHGSIYDIHQTHVFIMYIYKYLTYTPAPTVLNSQLWSPLLGYLVSPSKIATVLPTNLVGAKPLCPNWPINPSPAVGRCHRDRTSRGFPPAIFWWWGRINPYENSDSNGFRTQQFVLTR